MEVLKLIRYIDSNYLEELDRFKGETVEIIITHYNKNKNQTSNKQKAFEIVNKYSQNVKKWNREELYDR